MRIAAIFFVTLMAVHSASGYAAQYDFDNGFQAAIGVEAYSEIYTEYDTTQANTKFMQESAVMSGINSRFGFALIPASVAFITARYATGSSDYTGAYQNASGVSAGYGSLRSYGIPRGVYELGIGLTSNVFDSLSLGARVNHRVLTDHLETVAGGYLRKNTLLYDAVFIEYEFLFGKAKISPKATYKHLIRGTQYSSPTSGMTTGTNNTQNTGAGYDFEVSFSFPIEKRIVELTPFYRFMEIQNSNWVPANDGTGAVIMEPKNTTVEIGASFQMLF